MPLCGGRTWLEGCIKFEPSVARSRKQKVFATEKGESPWLKARESVQAVPRVLSLQSRPRWTVRILNSLHAAGLRAPWVENAFKGTLNLKPLRLVKELEFKAQRH